MKTLLSLGRENALFCRSVISRDGASLQKINILLIFCSQFPFVQLAQKIPKHFVQLFSKKFQLFLLNLLTNPDIYDIICM